MCIKSALYLHQKSPNWALNEVLFWWFWCWCCSLNTSHIASLEGVVPVSFIKIWSKFVPNNTTVKKVQIRQHKGSGTKMYKCLVRFMLLLHDKICYSINKKIAKNRLSLTYKNSIHTLNMYASIVLWITITSILLCAKKRLSLIACRTL